MAAQPKKPAFNDAWAASGRRYIPATSTDIRQTFARIRKQQALARLSRRPQCV